METISIINRTMDLSECKDKWFFNEKYQVWCLENILYTPCPTNPEFQRMSIFVPGPYMCAPGMIDPKGEINGYTASTVPVIFENNSAGYMQMPHVSLGDPRCAAEPYLAHGYIYVTCGNRGSESQDTEGKYCGRAPINLVDLKTAIRFLRHNCAFLPGNYDHIISIGWSAGGAMSTLLAVTGDNRNYDPYLKVSGAFMEESDAVFAAQIYCPVTDLDHADIAYEWTFRADHENEESPAGPAGVMTLFSEALSKELSTGYIRYFNSLGLKSTDGTLLFLGEDGRSGTAYECLMDELSEAATKYLQKCEAGSISTGFSMEDYLDSKSRWLAWDGIKAEVSDLDNYVLNQRRRMKPCTSFDVLSMNSGENRVFGTEEIYAKHFSQDVADAISALKESFPKEYAEYFPAFKDVYSDKVQQRQEYLINPYSFINTGEASRQAEHYRIRVGANDADTSFMVSLSLAKALQNAGKSVDYAIVWEKPHCEADYPGEVLEWIDHICEGD